jgi:alpha-tubulin suppressor-like RCC1 family protein
MNLRKAFSGESEHCVFITDTGEIKAIGASVNGALGVPNNTSTEVATLSFPEELLDLACGEHHSLALLKDHRIYVWGKNHSAQLGFDDKEHRYEPTLLPISLTEKFISVHSGGWFSAAITVQGALHTWGYHNEGHHVFLPPNLSPPSSPYPSSSPISSQVLDVACGSCHFVTLTRDGEVHVWACLESGKWDFGYHMTPLVVPLEEVVALAAGENYSFFLTSSGALYGLGDNDNGALGVGDQHPRLVPTIILSEGVAHVAGGGSHGIALMEDGRVLGWGWNLFAQVLPFGIGQPKQDVLTPTEVPIPEEEREEGEERKKKVVVGVGAGWATSWLITKDGSLYMWGDAERGAPVQRPEAYPSLYPWFKVQPPKPAWRESEWQNLFRWMFIGRDDPGCIFSVLPVEILFHMVGVEF